jgi:large subunit ribosomal protein L18
VELIDDHARKTIAAAHSREVEKGAALERARDVGRLIAKRAQALGKKKASFDRGGYVYAGKVRAVAEGAREGGLEF